MIFLPNHIQTCWRDRFCTLSSRIDAAKWEGQHLPLITKSHQRTGRQRCFSYQAIRPLRDVKPKPEMGEGGWEQKQGEKVLARLANKCQAEEQRFYLPVSLSSILASVPWSGCLQTWCYKFGFFFTRNQSKPLPGGTAKSAKGFVEWNKLKSHTV